MADGKQIIEQMRIKYLYLDANEYLRSRARTPHAIERAKAMGLAYWPALAYGPSDIDPRAYKIAEDYMHKKRQRDGSPVAPWAQGESHGVWDMFGNLGTSPHFVADAWRRAGYRDNALFRAQLTRRELALPGQSLAEYKAYARAEKWREKRRRRPTARISNKAMVALGKLSAELRYFALLGMKLNGVIRVRDLNWRAVRLAQQAEQSPIPRVRAATMPAPKAAKLLGVSQKDLSAALAPGFPNAPLEIARGIAIGLTPVELSGGLLTRREAHDWIMAGADEIRFFLRDYYKIPSHRSLKVMRWVIYLKQHRREALERRRALQLPYRNTIFLASLLDFLDEVQEEDILTGRDSVSAVIDRAVERRKREWLEECMKDNQPLVPAPKWASRLPQGVRLLLTPRELATEGQEMNHCVGGYVKAVERGDCFILAIETQSGRSTAELSSSLRIVQHKGYGDGLPPKENEKLLRELVRKLKGEKE